ARPSRRRPSSCATPHSMSHHSLPPEFLASQRNPRPSWSWTSALSLFPPAAFFRAPAPASRHPAPALPSASAIAVSPPAAPARTPRRQDPRPSPTPRPVSYLRSSFVFLPSQLSSR